MLLPKIFLSSDALNFRQMIIFEPDEILALQEISHILDFPTIWLDVPNYVELSQRIQFKLLMGENMSELSDAIIYLADSQRSCEVTQTVNACCNEYQAGSGGGDGQIVPTAPDAPPPSYGGTPGEYEMARCAGANLITDVLLAVTETVSEFVGMPSVSVSAVGGTIASLVTGASFDASIGVIVGGAVVLSSGEILAITAAIAQVGFAVDTFTTYIHDDIIANRENYVCAVYGADTGDGVISWALDMIEGALSSIGATTSQSIILRSIFAYMLHGTYLDRYFGGSYSGSFICECITEDYVFLFEGGVLKRGYLSSANTIVNGEIQNANGTYANVSWDGNFADLNSNYVVRLCDDVGNHYDIKPCNVQIVKNLSTGSSQCAQSPAFNLGTYCDQATNTDDNYNGHRYVNINGDWDKHPHITRLAIVKTGVE